MHLGNEYGTCQISEYNMALIRMNRVHVHVPVRTCNIHWYTFETKTNL